MLIMTALSAAQPLADSPTAILTTGSFHEGEVPKHSSGKWTALVCDVKRNCSAKSVLVSTRKVHDEIVDEDSSAETGTEVSVANLSGIVALIRGLTIHEGPIKTYFHGETRLQSGGLLKVNAQSGEFRLRIEGPRGSNEDPLPKGSKLILASGNKAQLLFGLPKGGNDPYITVVWIGDLDGDGIPYFLINNSDHYNVSNLVLYLSTRAKPGKIVGPAAHFTTVGC